PLHAVYTKHCLAPMEAMIKQDKLNIFELCDLVKVRYLSAEEINRFDPEHLSFFNVNTVDDLEKARELAGGDNKP
ncbi:molybdenum cofactor guanylyltransferase, partial [Chloroflexota bacterium]